MENTWDSWLTSPLASATCQNTLCVESPGAFQLTNHFNSTHLIMTYPAWSTPGNLSLHPLHLYLFCQGVCCMESIDYLQVAPILASAVLPRCPSAWRTPGPYSQHSMSSQDTQDTVSGYRFVESPRAPWLIPTSASAILSRDLLHVEPQDILACTHFCFYSLARAPTM